MQYRQRNLNTILSSAANVRSGCWRRRWWALVSARRYHNTHSTWINRLAATLPACSSGFGDTAWPSRSPNISVPDFFLWGHLKAKENARRGAGLGSSKSTSAYSYVYFLITTTEMYCTTGTPVTRRKY